MKNQLRTQDLVCLLLCAYFAGAYVRPTSQNEAGNNGDGVHVQEQSYKDGLLAQLTGSYKADLYFYIPEEPLDRTAFRNIKSAYQTDLNDVWMLVNGLHADLSKQWPPEAPNIRPFEGRVTLDESGMTVTVDHLKNDRWEYELSYVGVVDSKVPYEGRFPTVLLSDKNSDGKAYSFTYHVSKTETGDLLLTRGFSCDMQGGRAPHFIVYRHWEGELPPPPTR